MIKRVWSAVTTFTTQRGETSGKEANSGGRYEKREGDEYRATEEGYEGRIVGGKDRPRVSDNIGGKRWRKLVNPESRRAVCPLCRGRPSFSVDSRMRLASYDSAVPKSRAREQQNAFAT